MSISIISLRLVLFLEIPASLTPTKRVHITFYNFWKSSFALCTFHLIVNHQSPTCFQLPKTPLSYSFGFHWILPLICTHLHPLTWTLVCIRACTCVHMCAQSLSFPSQIIRNGSNWLHNPPQPSTTPPPAQTPPYRFLRLRRVCAVVTALIRWSLPLAVFNPHATPFCFGDCGWTLVWRFCQVPKSLLPFPRGVHWWRQNWILRGGKIHPRKNFFATSPILD